MNLEEYKEGMKSLKYIHSKNVEALHIEYANSNNPHKKGEIVTDHIGSIIIDYIGYSVYAEICTCTYRGVMCRKKDNKPYASGQYREVFQTNLIN